jgi:hypothetical protein
MLTPTQSLSERVVAKCTVFDALGQIASHTASVVALHRSVAGYSVQIVGGSFPRCHPSRVTRDPDRPLALGFSLRFPAKRRFH